MARIVPPEQVPAQHVVVEEAGRRRCGVEEVHGAGREEETRHAEAEGPCQPRRPVVLSADHEHGREREAEREGGAERGSRARTAGEAAVRGGGHRSETRGHERQDAGSDQRHVPSGEERERRERGGDEQVRDAPAAPGDERGERGEREERHQAERDRRRQLGERGRAMLDDRGRGHLGAAQDAEEPEREERAREAERRRRLRRDRARGGRGQPGHGASVSAARVPPAGRQRKPARGGGAHQLGPQHDETEHRERMQVGPHRLQHDQGDERAEAEARAVEHEEVGCEQEERRRLGPHGEALDRGLRGEHDERRRAPGREPSPCERGEGGEGSGEERGGEEDRPGRSPRAPRPVRREVEEPLPVDPRRARRGERERIGARHGALGRDQSAAREVPPGIGVVQGVHLERHDEEKRRRRGSLGRSPARHGEGMRVADRRVGDKSPRPASVLDALRSGC